MIPAQFNNPFNLGLQQEISQKQLKNQLFKSQKAIII